MALPKFYKVVTDQQGNIVPQVLGSVYNKGTAVLASLYQDDAGAIPLANPMTSDATYGSFKFYLNPGHYDLTFTKPGYTFEPIYDMQVPQDVLTLGTMATQNANAVAITGGQVQGLTDLAVGMAHVTGHLVDVGAGGLVQINSPVGLSAVPNASTALTLGGALTSVAAVALTGEIAGGSRLLVEFNKGATHGIWIQHLVSDTGGTYPVLFVNMSGGVAGTISTTATSTSYNTSSDARMKHAVTVLTGALAALQALRPVAFRWNATDQSDIGFLAHELMVPVPTAVTGQPDEVNPDGSIRPQQVDHSKLVPLLTAGIKELLAQVETLTARVTQLETALGRV